MLQTAQWEVTGATSTPSRCLALGTAPDDILRPVEEEPVDEGTALEDTEGTSGTDEGINDGADDGEVDPEPVDQDPTDLPDEDPDADAQDGDDPSAEPADEDPATEDDLSPENDPVD